MNRIYQEPLTTQSLSEPSIQLRQARLQTSPNSATPHALFSPLHYEKKYAYPLLVWLHGPGDDERQLQRIMPLLSMRNYVAVGPRACCQDERQPLGFCWRQTERDVAIAQQRVLDCIDVASARFNVATNRVFLGGYDCGGTMAFQIALKHPERFAGVLSAGGPFPTSHTPLVNLRSARQLPLFIARGHDAERYTPHRMCEELRLFHVAAFSVAIRQYPCGDELTTQMLCDMDMWMMERVTDIKLSDNDESIALDGRN